MKFKDKSADGNIKIKITIESIEELKYINDLLDSSTKSHDEHYGFHTAIPYWQLTEIAEKHGYNDTENDYILTSEIQELAK